MGGWDLPLAALPCSGQEQNPGLCLRIRGTCPLAAVSSDSGLVNCHLIFEYLHGIKKVPRTQELQPPLGLTLSVSPRHLAG